MLDSLSGILASVWREAVIMFIFYFLQFLMIMADLWAGIRKSKRAGIGITSRRLRGSIDKLCQYYSLSLMCSAARKVTRARQWRRWISGRAWRGMYGAG